jgi:hypothetical protein
MSTALYAVSTSPIVDETTRCDRSRFMGHLHVIL